MPNAKGGCSLKCDYKVFVKCKSQKLPKLLARLFDIAAYKTPSINIPSENKTRVSIPINIEIIIR